MAYGDILGCLVHGEELRVGTPHALGRGLYLFSVPAVFLLLNLNSQVFHHSCIPEWRRGLRWQLGPGKETGNPVSISFHYAAGEAGEWSWALVLKSQCGKGLSGASGLG